MANGNQGPLTPDVVQALQAQGAISPDTAALMPAIPGAQAIAPVPDPIAPVPAPLAPIPAPAPALTPPLAPLAPQADSQIVQEEIQKRQVLEEAQARNEQILEEARQRLKTSGGGQIVGTVQEPSQLEVLEEAERIELERAEEEALQTAQEDQDLADRLANRKREIELSEKFGRTIETDPELDPLLEEQTIAEGAQADLERPATPEDIQELSEPTVQDVAQASEPIKQQRAAQEAQKQDITRRQDRIRQAEKDIEQEDEEIGRSFTSLGEVFKEGSTGQKIGAALAILAGGLAQGLSGATKNPALAVINREFDQEMKRQKLGLREKLGLEKFKNKEIDRALKLRGLALKDEKQRLEVERLRMRIAEDNRNNTIERLVGKLGAEDISISPEVEAQLPESIKERLIALPDGGKQVGNSKTAVNNARKMLDESQSAQAQIDNVLNLIDEASTTERLNPVSVKGSQIRTSLDALVGKLRIPLTGPGVLTDTEYTRLRKTIGQPTAFRSLLTLEAEKAKLKQIQDLLKQSDRITYKNSGITLPRTDRERIIDTYVDRMKQKGSDISFSQAEQALRRIGKIK